MKKLIILLVTVWFPLLASAQWVNINQGFNPRSFTSTGANLYVGSSSGLYRSSNNGANFTRISRITFNSSVAAMGVNGTRVFAGTNSSGSGGFYYTTDGDTNWTQTFLSPVDNILVTPSFVFIISQSQVWRSSNNGVSFIQTSAPMSYSLGSNASGSMIYCGTNQGLYSSNNNGSSWTFLNILDTLVNSDIKVGSNNNIYACTKSNGIRAGSIWTSTNNGGTWLRKQLLPGNGISYYSMALKDNNVIVGTDSGVLLSRDNGANWVTKNEGLGSMKIASKLFISDVYVFASVSAELWRRLYLDAIYIKKISEQIPDSYSLSQNYPNPFNPSTTINYSILTKGVVKLKVYDALGRFITTLNDAVQTPGTYALSWDAGKYSSGVYYYELQSENFKQTKRMLLIK